MRLSSIPVRACSAAAFLRMVHMSRPLLDAYAGLVSNIPIVPLVHAPTPVERFNTATVERPELAGLWIKRDDLTSPVYGGNKVRKLEFVLADTRGYDEIVTVGALGTNHGVATALFCKAQGIACRLVLFDQPVTDKVKHNLRLMQASGAQLEYRGNLISAMLYLYARRVVRRNSYYLPPGGSSVLGTLGSVNAAFELKAQIARGDMPEPDRIVCPVGSSGTLAGLVLGCELAGLRCRVQGISVLPSHAGPIPVCTAGRTAALARKTHRFLCKHSSEVPSAFISPVHLDDRWVGRGYGFPTSEGSAATELFALRGINLEPTYTAKAAAAALQYCRENPGQTVLYWHTFNSVPLEAPVNDAGLAQLPARLRAVLGG